QVWKAPLSRLLSPQIFTNCLTRYMLWYRIPFVVIKKDDPTMSNQVILPHTAKIEYRKGCSRREKHVSVQCNGCGYIRRMTMSSAKRVKSCRKCSSRAALARVDRQNWLEGMRSYQLRNQNGSEALVADFLSKLKLSV